MSEILIRATPRTTERVVGDTTIVELSGEIDIFTAPRIGARLNVLCARPFPDLVLDLREVSFIDCSGLGLLCRVSNSVRARHGRLRLVTDSPRFLRILRLTGLSGAFELCGGLQDAPAASPCTGAAHLAGG
ncbi:STAS domain-containing protein [Streptomyces sp. NPDC052023]|uniref:STAS domain-containing protein n=1 Tax=Streptomyces sp. NPDC052023 TaxID=3365681 RepID=UPI0037D98237